jgi:putative transposase
MPRKPRVSIVGVTEQIIQRGNNRQIIFAQNSDMKAYIDWVKEYAEKFDIGIHT